MKIALIIFSLVFIVNCKHQDNNSQNKTVPLNEYTIIGEEVLVELETGTYVYDGSAHPTLFGNVMDAISGAYKLAIWENGNVKIEEGTYSFKTIKEVDDINYTITYFHKIVYQPTRYNPSSCGYSLDSYEKDYFWTSNGADMTTQWISSISSSLYDYEYNQAVGWPTNLTPDYVESNLNPTCL